MASKTRRKKDRQRFPKHREIARVLEKAKREWPCEFEFARQVFETYVDPEAYYKDEPSPLDIQRTNIAFTEWFLFDCDIFEGLTLFELMAEEDPTLDECARTQFYSRFWVVDRDVERGRVVLRDLSTQRDFSVRSSHIASTERWATGTLGTRIARAHGVWKEIGKIALHDNSESEPLPARTKGRRRIRHDPAAFINNIEQTIGHHGEYAESLARYDEEEGRS